MSRITTHILDTAIGKPAAGVAVGLYLEEGGEFKELLSQTTDGDGRVKNFGDESLGCGVYKLVFNIGEYFEGQNREVFFPRADLVFKVSSSSEHYHVPLLLSGFGYSTYRGS